jgi:hypothetical protein
MFGDRLGYLEHKMSLAHLSQAEELGVLRSLRNCLCCIDSIENMPNSLKGA